VAQESKTISIWVYYGGEKTHWNTGLYTVCSKLPYTIFGGREKRRLCTRHQDLKVEQYESDPDCQR